MAKSRFESAITEKWFGKANEFEPKPGTNYEWVWEYAKFRLAWATERVQHVEGKALEFVKLVLVCAAAGWAVLTFLKVRPSELSIITLGCLFISLELLVAAAVYALRAYVPTKRLIPVAEDAALRCANEFPAGSEGMAKFCQTLSSATESETKLAARKGGFILFAACSLTSAVILFLSAIFLGVPH